MDISELSDKLICEKHFIPTDININNKRKLLNKNAVPVKYVEPIISVQGTIKTYGRKRKTHVKENTENSSEEDEETLAILVHSSEAGANNSGGFKNFRDFLQELPTPGTGPYFDTTVNSNITGLVGRTVHLHCRVKNLGNRTIYKVSGTVSKRLRRVISSSNLTSEHVRFTWIRCGDAEHDRSCTEQLSCTGSRVPVGSVGWTSLEGGADG
ncbi:hypothetical protein FQA39_LY02481 [Lamprigera yunnana]|nr:hypothetical protein FQA39_LY02481 [Lamprigera yunnana]